MNRRCYNPKAKNYKDYGGRGVGICDRWRGESGFQNFLSDMGEPAGGMSIERKDNNRGYSPDNCIWIPMADQAKNRRHNWTVSLNGEEMTAREATRRLGIGQNVIAEKLRGMGASKREVYPLNDLVPAMLPKWGMEHYL
jgi:hypothetical protein